MKHFLVANAARRRQNNDVGARLYSMHGTGIVKVQTVGGHYFAIQ